MNHLTTEEFKEKIFDYEKQNENFEFKGDKITIIDFYADWCGPCRMLSPILEELDKENEDVDFYKVDTESEQELSYVFGIRSIPSILFIPKNGKPEMTTGALPKDKFQEIINRFKEGKSING